MVSKSPELLIEFVHEGILADALHNLFPNEKILRHARKNVSLKNPDTGYSLELDFWIPSLNIAFEFQDSYHYTTAWATQLPLSIIREKDSSKRHSLLSRGGTLITVPYWWQGSESSLAASIKFFRPDIYVLVDESCDPIHLNSPTAHVHAKGSLGRTGVPGIGELMLASYPVNLQFNTTVATSPWWLGEKYDGMRVCWQPALQHIFTRSGARIRLLKPVARQLGKSTYFDGEIWFGRGCFEETQTFVKLISLNEINWPYFRFIVFDSPKFEMRKFPFERRYRHLMKAVPRSHPTLKLAPRMMCRDPALLEEVARLIIKDGGEGVILRKPGSKYESGRSASLLKLKAVRGDVEALIVEDNGDGTCVLQLPDPALPTFKATKEIQQVLKRGDIVSIAFDTYSRNSLPVNPKILRVRLDQDWNEVKRSYLENVSQSQKFNDNTTRVFKGNRQAGYWSVKENIRKLLEDYARSLNKDPQDPHTWYSVTQAEIVKFKGSAQALVYYKGSFVKAAIDLFPELNLKAINFVTVPKNYWKNFDNRRTFFVKYAEAKGLDPLVPATWYEGVSLNNILESKGGYSLMSYYNGSPSAAVMHVFPELNLQISKFRFMPIDYWGTRSNRLRHLNEFANAKGFDPLVAANWYSVKADDVWAHGKHGFGLCSYYKRGLRKALLELYPDIGLDSSKFVYINSFWSDVKNRREVFETYAAHKKFDHLKGENWQDVDFQDFLEWKNAARLLSRYQFSLEQALRENFPEIELVKGAIAKPSLKLSRFLSTAKSREMLLKFAEKKGFDPLVARNWYLVSRQDINTLQNENRMYRNLSKNFISFVKSVLPNVVFSADQKINKPANYWRELENRRKFFEELAAKKGFSPLSIDDWYNVSTDDILGEKGGITLLNQYKGNRTTALRDAFPELHFDESKFANMWKKYYADARNRRKPFDEFAASRAFDPFVAENWYSISSEDLLPFQGIASVLTFYKGSFVNALEHLYPDIGIKIENFSFARRDAMKDWETRKRRAFFEKFAKKRGFDPLVFSNWISVVGTMHRIPGLAWVLAPFRGQPLVAVSKLFPEFEIPENYEMLKLHKINK